MSNEGNIENQEERDLIAIDDYFDCWDDSKDDTDTIIHSTNEEEKRK